MQYGQSLYTDKTAVKARRKRRRIIGWSVFGGIMFVILVAVVVCGVRWAVHSKAVGGYGEYAFSEISARLDPEKTDFDEDEFIDAFPHIVIAEDAATVKVLQIADPQIKFGNITRDNKTMDLLSRAIEAEKPDLCVVTGDLTFSIFTYDAYKYFADFMEKRKQYWALAYGNHDSQFDCSKYTLYKLLSGYEYCLFQRGPSDIHGESNYLVNVFRGSKKAENLVYGFVLLDSGMYPDDVELKISDRVYDWIRRDQLDWYAWAVKGLQRIKADIQTTMFFHIPVREFADMHYLNELAHNRDIPDIVRKSLDEKGMDTTLIRDVKGVVREYEKSENEVVYGDDGYTVGVCYQGNVEGADHPDVFDAIKRSGSTRALFCGHDHVNTLKGYFDGIYLGYGLCCGYHTYPYFDTAFWFTDLFGLSDKILFNAELWTDENGNRMERGVTVIEIDMRGDYGELDVSDRPDSYYLK